MAKNKKSTKPVESTPSFLDIITDTQAQMDALKAKQAEAKAKFNDAVAPFRAKRDKFISAIKALMAQRAEELAPAIQKRDEAVAKANKELAEFEATLDAKYQPLVEAEKAHIAKNAKAAEKELGIPEVLLNEDLKPEPRTRSTKKDGTSSTGGSRKTASLSDVGEIGATVVVAPKRYPNPDGDKFDAVRYEIAQNDEGKLVIRGVKVGHTNTEGVLEMDADPFAKAYTHESTVPSEVIAKQGWHNTPDVMYVLLSLNGKGGYEPSAPAASLGHYDPETKAIVYLDAEVATTEAVEETV